MDQPSFDKSRVRPRSNSAPCLGKTQNKNPSTGLVDVGKRTDAAVDRGLEIAQKKLYPIISQLCAESDQRMADIFNTPQLHADDTEIGILDLLDSNIAMITKFLDTNQISCEEIENLLQKNIRAKKQIIYADGLRRDAALNGIQNNTNMRNSLAEIDKMMQKGAIETDKILRKTAEEDERRDIQEKNNTIKHVKLKQELEKKLLREEQEEEKEQKTKDLLRLTINCLIGGTSLVIIASIIWYKYFHGHS